MIIIFWFHSDVNNLFASLKAGVLVLYIETGAIFDEFILGYLPVSVEVRRKIAVARERGRRVAAFELFE